MLVIDFLETAYDPINPRKWNFSFLLILNLELIKKGSKEFTRQIYCFCGHVLGGTNVKFAVSVLILSQLIKFSPGTKKHRRQEGTC